MRHGSTSTEFDLSDVDSARDSVDTIYALAESVLEDYGSQGTTRIERMARWIVDEFGLVTRSWLSEERSGSLSRYMMRPGSVWRVVDRVGLMLHGDAKVRPLTVGEAREIVVSLLRAIHTCEVEQ
ncbi:MAG: hypothetical protein ACTHU0_17055 [Kofleriaceae bacterium]